MRKVVADKIAEQLAEWAWYFWKIVRSMGFVAATFVAGAVTLGLVIYMESKRRAGKVSEPA